jgi:hypothetical protein
MNEFSDFVNILGSFADNYSEEQLQQLHRDVKVFAEIVIAIMRTTSEQPVNGFEVKVSKQCSFDFTNTVRRHPTTAPHACELI